MLKQPSEFTGSDWQPCR